MTSPQAQQIREWLIQNVKMAEPASLEEARARGEAQAGQAPLAPGTVVEPVAAGTVPAEWVSANPDGAAATGRALPDAVLLHLHGGGYTMGSLGTARMLASLLAACSGARALSVDYRLAPEHPFPAALEDALAAYAWLLAEGVEPRRIVFTGDSAGGGLALATMLSLRDKQLPLPAAGALISPWTDLSGSGASVVSCAEVDPFLNPGGLHEEARRYAGETDVCHPLLSPLFADLKGLPPLLIHAGTHDILVDDSRRFAERATAAGVEVTLRVWDEMWHVWHVFSPQLPEASEALADIGRFVRARLAPSV